MKKAMISRNIIFVAAIFIVIAFMAVIFMAACGNRNSQPNSSKESFLKSDELAAAIQRSQQDLPELIQITSEDNEFAIWLFDNYVLSAEQISDGVVCYAAGAEASEIAVLQITEEAAREATEEILNALQEYIKSRISAFEGYAPKQAALAEKGIVVENGR